MNEHPSEDYMRTIKGVKILKDDSLNDDEIKVSPRVYEKMKSELKGKPVGFSPKIDKDFQKLLDQVDEPDFSSLNVDLTPTYKPIDFSQYAKPNPSPEESFKKTLEQIIKGRGYL